MKYIISLIIQNSKSKSITKQHYNTLYVVFMHGWLVQL